MDKNMEHQPDIDRETVEAMVENATTGRTGRGGTRLGQRSGIALNNPNYTVDPDIQPEDRQEGHVDEPLHDAPVALPPDPLTLSDAEKRTEPGA